MSIGVLARPINLLVYIPLVVATLAATVGTAMSLWSYAILEDYRSRGEFCEGTILEATGNRYDAPSSVVVQPRQCLDLDSISMTISGLGFDPDNPVSVGDEFAFYVIVEADEVRAIQATALDVPAGWQALGLGVLALVLWGVSFVVRPWKRLASTSK